MTNGDDLVHPYAWKLGEDGKTPIVNEKVNALTKREHFALQILQGLSANSGYNSTTWEATARLSVKQADILIKALNNEL